MFSFVSISQVQQRIHCTCKRGKFWNFCLVLILTGICIYYKDQQKTLEMGTLDSLLENKMCVHDHIFIYLFFVEHFTI